MKTIRQLARQVVANMFMSIPSGITYSRGEWVSILAQQGVEKELADQALDYLIKFNLVATYKLEWNGNEWIKKEINLTVAPAGCHDFKIHTTMDCSQEVVILPKENFQEPKTWDQILEEIEREIK